MAKGVKFLPFIHSFFSSGFSSSFAQIVTLNFFIAQTNLNPNESIRSIKDFMPRVLLQLNVRGGMLFMVLIFAPEKVFFVTFSDWVEKIILKI